MSEKGPKKPRIRKKIYSCEKCNYNTYSITNYKKHLTTKKHKNIQEYYDNSNNKQTQTEPSNLEKEHEELKTKYIKLLEKYIEK